MAVTAEIRRWRLRQAAVDINKRRFDFVNRSIQHFLILLPIVANVFASVLEATVGIQVRFAGLHSGRKYSSAFPIPNRYHL